MAMLLSGSFGLHNKYKKYIGALVYVKSQRSLGYVLKAIDLEFDLELCRMNIWMPKETFGTFIDDINIIQILTSSYGRV